VALKFIPSAGKLTWTTILVTMDRMEAWTVEVDDRAMEDLRAIDRKEARLILRAARERLSADPRAETRNMKTLRPNPVGERELRLFGKYRVLFTVSEAQRRVLIFVVGEKRGQCLFVRGKRFTQYENHPTT